MEFFLLNLPWLGVIVLSFIRKPVARVITGTDKASVLTVIDAHLEMLSMILLTTIWAVGYGWVEGVINVGAALTKLNQIGFLSTYHIFLGATVVAISFSFGLLKGRRMLIHQKRYMFFAACGNVAYSLVVQDFSYFFFVPATDRLDALSWTCSGLGLGCKVLRAPWNPNIPVAIPVWYFLALAFAGMMFFLGYRSALVNLLVTREVVKQVSFVEKVLLSPFPQEVKEKIIQPTPVPVEKPATIIQKLLPTKPEVQAQVVVATDREELVRKLRERLLRQGT
jgi:hypothetical protein